MDQLESIRTFHEVVHSGSLSRAAQKLDISATALSRQVRALEKRLGICLFSRETRALSLTKVGSIYFERTRELVCSLDDCERSIANMVHKPIGTLRIVAPEFFSYYGLAQCLYRYNKTYPDVRLELTLNDRPLNLVHDGFDIGLVDTSLIPHYSTSLIARHVVSERLVACASLEYLQRRGVPDNPCQLCDHAYVALTAQPAGTRELLLEGPDGTQHVVEKRPTMVVNNIDALIQMLVSGAGIGFAPSALVHQQIGAGKLQKVFPGYSTPTFSISIVYPSREHMPAKVRTFIDHLLQTVNEPAYNPTEPQNASHPDQGHWLNFQLEAATSTINDQTPAQLRQAPSDAHLKFTEPAI